MNTVPLQYKIESRLLDGLRLSSSGKETHIPKALFTQQMTLRAEHIHVPMPAIYCQRLPFCKGLCVSFHVVPLWFLPRNITLSNVSGRSMILSEESVVTVKHVLYFAVLRS